MAIITSLLDTDIYKIRMMQAGFHHFRDAWAEYAFACRSEGVDLRPLAGAVRNELDALCALRFTDEELRYLEHQGVATDFLDYLSGFRLHRYDISVNVGRDALLIRAAGTFLGTTLFEIPVLAIVSELYSRRHDIDVIEGRRRLTEKLNMIAVHPLKNAFRLAEFGGRRRASLAWHREVLTTMKERIPEQLIGTSNVLLAKELELNVIGTMAHEYLQRYQAIAPRLEDSQKLALSVWAEEYPERLRIALTDVIGIDAFLNDFDKELAGAYAGVRHDSGDPVAWGEKIIAHYESLGIDPMSKTLLFSDALDIPKALRLLERFHARTKVAFGIGTNLVNDLGRPALNIVMKLVRLNGKPVAKISDTPGKTMCKDSAYLARLRRAFGLPQSFVKAS